MRSFITCIKLKLGSVCAGVALQGQAVVQTLQPVRRARRGLLGLGERVGPQQAYGLEALGHHDELHPLPGQGHQPFLQGHQGGQAIVLEERRDEFTWTLLAPPTDCVLYVLALNVRTYSRSYLVIVLSCVASYPSYLCWGNGLA